jgi:hypothetical protein
MKKESKSLELTSEQIAEMRKERILSDAKAVKGGAEVDAEGKVYFTEDQKREARRKMEKDFAEKRSELPKHGKENWKELVGVLGSFNVTEDTYNSGFSRMDYSGDMLVMKDEGPSTGDGGGPITSERPIKVQDLETIRKKLLEYIDKLENEGKETVGKNKEKDGMDRLKTEKEALEFLDAEIEVQKK